MAEYLRMSHGVEAVLTHTHTHYGLDLFPSLTVRLVYISLNANP